MDQKALVTCPLSELGFLRMSTNPRACNVSLALAGEPIGSNDAK
jgi:hypothetical protein